MGGWGNWAVLLLWGKRGGLRKSPPQGKKRIRIHKTLQDTHAHTHETEHCTSTTGTVTHHDHHHHHHHTTAGAGQSASGQPCSPQPPPVQAAPGTGNNGEESRGLEREGQEDHREDCIGWITISLKAIIRSKMLHTSTFGRLRVHKWSW